MPADLSGLLVVSLEQAVAAPYASGRLAEAGARVIKVERPEGDFARGYDSLVHGESAYFVWLNRGKESVCLDLRDAGDHALMARMLARADVFIQNLAPGAIERLGFAPRAAARGQSPPHHRLDLGLWHRRPDGGSQGLRPAGAGRDGAGGDHRQRRTGPRAPACRSATSRRG